jgi:hypothetical protein
MKRQNTTQGARVAAFAIRTLGIIASLASASHAATFNWTGGTSNTLNNTNYSTGTSPYNGVADVVNISGGGLVFDGNNYALEGVDTYNVFNGGVIQNVKDANKIISGNGATVNVGTGGTYAPANRLSGVTLNLSGSGVLILGNSDTLLPNVISSTINLDSAWTGEIYFTARPDLDEVSELMTWLDTGAGAGKFILDGIPLTSADLGSKFTVNIVTTGSGNEPAFARVDAGLTLTLITGGDPFSNWATSGTVTGVTFGGDANSDGVQDGLAFLLGAASPDDNALNLLPVASGDDGGLVLTFSMRNTANRGDATLTLQWSNDLGMSDLWTTNEALVPDDDATVNGVVFDFTPSDPLNSVTATLPAAAASGGKLFSRIKGEEN